VLSPAVDTHAHVFLRDLPMDPRRRYTPGYDAGTDEYLAQLDRAGFGRALLVQPSFLGSDNSYLAAAIAEHPDRLRGVCVLEDPDPASLREMHARGLRGLRLNLIGASLPELGSGPWQRVGAAMAELGWHLELQARGPQWAQLDEALRRWPAPVVLDHLGLPHPGDDGTVARLAALEHVWVKLSAPYRAGSATAVEERLRDLGASTGLARTVFGTDWPFTQHEEGRSMSTLAQWAQRVLTPAEWELVRGNGRRFLDSCWDEVPGEPASSPDPGPGSPAPVAPAPGPGW